MAPPMEKTTSQRNAGDRISDLPDYMLHHILSFLEIRYAVATSILSSRWRYLWTTSPTLAFYAWAPEKITLALIRHDRSLTIRKFQAFCPTFVGFTSDIDSWIRFAVRHKVQELELQFGEDELENFVGVYRVHRCMYTCRSVESLKLRHCVLNLPTSVHLPLLKTLELQHMNLTDVEIKILMSGCLLLENMTLAGCNNTNKLIIFAPNQNLKRLSIVNRMYTLGDESEIDISAPNVVSLELGGYVRKNYIIRDLSSIAGVSIDFEYLLFEEYRGEVDQMVGLLSHLSRARTLKLCGWCVQLFSVREVVDTSSLYLHATYLELNTGLSKLDYMGIAFLLRSSRHIEALVINIREKHVLNQDYRRLDDWSKELSEYDIGQCWESIEISLSSQFAKLKTIKINGFMGSKICSLMEGQHIEIEELIGGRYNEVELVKHLLKNSKKLENMIIIITKGADCYGPTIKAELLDNLTKTLSTFPRASQNADIVLRME